MNASGIVSPVDCGEVDSRWFGKRWNALDDTQCDKIEINSNELMPNSQPVNEQRLWAHFDVISFYCEIERRVLLSTENEQNKKDKKEAKSRFRLSYTI